MMTIYHYAVSEARPAYHAACKVGRQPSQSVKSTAVAKLAVKTKTKNEKMKIIEASPSQTSLVS